MEFWQQLKLLIWAHFVGVKRSPGFFIALIVLPAIPLAAIMGVRFGLPAKKIEPTNYFD